MIRVLASEKKSPRWRTALRASSVCVQAISVGLLGMFLEGKKISFKSFELSIRNPAQSPAPPCVDFSGQVVSPLQRNDTFMLDSRDALSD